MADSDIYDVQVSDGEIPKTLKTILEEFIHITVEYADDAEMLHIYGDKILLDTLKHMLNYLPEAGAQTLSKIIKMFEDNPRWYL